MAFRRVFVPGVNEGLFPRPPAEDPLLLEAQRATLGIELRADDTELLRIAAACASERLTLSFSRLDLLTGRERVPSFYAFAAHRAAGGPEIDVREFEDRARAATETRIGWPAPREPGRRDRRRRVRSRHAGAARARLGAVSEEPAGPRRGLRCARAGCAGTSRGSRPTGCSSKRSAATR